MRICIDTNDEIRNGNRFKFGLRQGARVPIVHSFGPSIRLIGRDTARLVLAMMNRIDLWQARSAQRRRLAALDDRLLKDFGVSRCDAEAEIRKPFWRQ